MSAGPIVPILIQVPALRATARTVEPGPASATRLRKEVRVAGLTMMSVLPVGFLLLALGGAQPVDRPARAAARPRCRPRRPDGIDVGLRLLSRRPPPRPRRRPSPSSSAAILLPVDGPEEPELHAGR